MKKQILNIGKALNKTEQKSINGGGPGPVSPCLFKSDCPDGYLCTATWQDYPDGTYQPTLISSGVCVQTRFS
jgi:hypothetical protein